MRRAVLFVELALTVALVVLIGVAAWKFTRVLDRLHAGRLTALAFAMVFAGAALFAGRRALTVARRLKEDGNDDERIPRRR